MDAAVWTVAAAASLLSTAVLSAGGYAVLAWASCAGARAVTVGQARRRAPGTSPESAGRGIGRP
ncbi:hypothetical protein [Actinomadura mexicana]|uniref:Uncharacterized protein n=1 Tax=Actinomadura mexicana TaxID=134959 RepID=A0A239A756_9ACTN|nr:hypothetical protein [Actinomadura mexicana]SNR91506.1 hypothetical protein SAMN06265355_108241 [Actinomadura mexicana]